MILILAKDIQASLNVGSTAAADNGEEIVHPHQLYYKLASFEMGWPL